MPRVRQRGNGASRPARAPQTAPVPDGLLDSLVKLFGSRDANGHGQEAGAAERPNKRFKPAGDVGDFEAIPITNVDIALPPRNEKVLSPGVETAWSNAGDVVKLSWARHPGESEPDLWEVLLEARNPTKLRVSFTVEGRRFTELERACLDWISQKSQDSGLPGCVWAALDGLRIRQVGDDAALMLSVRVNWNTGGAALTHLKASEQSHRKFTLLRAWKFALSVSTQTSLSSPMEKINARLPQEFYEAACIPDKKSFDRETASMLVPGMTAKLYSFQRRAVQWLLRREGVHWSEGTGQAEAAVRPYVSPQASQPPLSFAEAADLHGRAFYLSPLCGVAAREVPEVRGGILAEEMGLGKTLEIISLIILHRQPPQHPDQALDFHSGQLLRACPATLIVTPSALLEQWISELKRHAPGLNVLHYDSLKKASKRAGTDAFTADLFAKQDVVVTTYDVLKREVWAAKAALHPTSRSMRGERKHQPPRSPLIEVMWWRVCIDEAQMVENVTSRAAEMAKIIPRVNAWCVSGTPVKNNIKTDLHGLLVFLRAEPYADNMYAWEQLVGTRLPDHQDCFSRLFCQLAMRHTKSLVRDEIDVPAQRRYVISMPFSAVEEQHYRDLFSALAAECGLNDQGQPVQDDWDPNDPAVKEAMRRALDRLRQTALHPEIGLLNRQNLRGQGQKVGGRCALRTLAEVLDAMIDQTEIAIKTDQRSRLQLHLKLGQILARLGRVNKARGVWEDTLKNAADLVQVCREQLAREIEEARKEDNESHRRPKDKADGEDDGKGQDRDDSVPSRVGEARRRLRSMLEIEHVAVFFCANAYFTIKSNPFITKPDSEEFKRLEQKETEAYSRAKAIRKEIVHDAYVKVKSSMDKLAAAARRQGFAVIPNTKVVPQGGIESHRISLTMQDMFDMLDRQANQLDAWRETVIQSLIKPLVDEEDEEVTGEEYDQSTKVQDEVMTFLQVLHTTIADRQTTMTGRQNMLVEHEVKTSTELANRAEGPCPEKMLELLAVRQRVRCEFSIDDPLTSLRSVISELRSLATKLRHDEARGSSRAAAENQIVLGLSRLAQATLSEQGTAIVAMFKEAERFTDILNARIDFYRQLQAVSDSVADPKGNAHMRDTQTTLSAEANLSLRIESAKDKLRYLMHLKEVETNGSDESRMCIICQCPFEIGVLTPCGHKFCKECLDEWIKASRNCPMCKRQISRSSLQDISLKPQELKVHSDNISAASSSSSSADVSAVGSPSSGTAQRRGQIYTDFQPDKLAEIKNIDLLGPSFTTKVDTMVRHLLWLRATDPGAKSIVFSQYREFLGVLAQAFRQNGIGYTSFDGTEPRGSRGRRGGHGGAGRGGGGGGEGASGGGIAGEGAHFAGAHPPATHRQHDSVQSFKEDPDVEVLLLSARAHASGLNLVNASHVFLCEPLLNTALELQAIARVDRIGQQQETTVWLYIVRGTVEESIHSLSVQRRLEHMMNRREDSSSSSHGGDGGQSHSGKGKEVDVEDAPSGSADNGNSSSSHNDTSNGTHSDEEDAVEQAEPNAAGAAEEEEGEEEGLDPGSLDAANTVELQQARLSKLMGKGNSGEVVDDKDLWACLFGHAAK